MVDYIKENAKMDKPTYLVQRGAFEEREAVKAKNHTPLYKYFLTK